MILETSSAVVIQPRDSSVVQKDNPNVDNHEKQYGRCSSQIQRLETFTV